MKKFEQFITESLEDRQRKSKEDAQKAIDKLHNYLSINKELTDQDSVGDHMKQSLGFKPNTDSEHEGVKAYMDMPKWKEDYTCFIFILRGKEMDPDNPAPKNPWSIDSWMKVDYNEPQKVTQAYTMMKMRAQANANSYPYAVWLPNEIAEQIDEKDNPEEYMELLMKYKFKI